MLEFVGGWGIAIHRTDPVLARHSTLQGAIRVISMGSSPRGGAPSPPFGQGVPCARSAGMVGGPEDVYRRRWDGAVEGRFFNCVDSSIILDPLDFFQKCLRMC
jgi:hypothetical protein